MSKMDKAARLALRENMQEVRAEIVCVGTKMDEMTLASAADALRIAELERQNAELAASKVASAVENADLVKRLKAATRDNAQLLERAQASEQRLHEIRINIQKLRKRLERAQARVLIDRSYAALCILYEREIGHV
jgi:DNA repair exonuclease SbcCD ATPase subunit